MAGDAPGGPAERPSPGRRGEHEHRGQNYANPGYVPETPLRYVAHVHLPQW